jgi:putative tryptophan/tyrosine transport system substrate-binding protein
MLQQYRITEMKNLGRFLIIVISWLIFFGCNPQSEKPTIGIIQYSNHAILDTVYAGIRSVLDNSSEKYKIQYQIAHGDPILNATISKQFVRDSVNLIIALGTPSAQAVATETKTIPIVFTAITDPVGAKLVETLKVPNGNKTGYTNMQPFDKQVELILKLKPNVERVGIVINSSEANCEAGMFFVREALNAYGLAYEEMNAVSSAEIITAAQSLARRCDVFFISPSNTVYQNLGALKKVAEKNDIMIIGGDESSVAQYGSLGTYTFDYFEMGINTADLALKILQNNLNPERIPVSRPDRNYLYINHKLVKELGLQVPESLKILESDQ